MFFKKKTLLARSGLPELSEKVIDLSFKNQKWPFGKKKIPEKLFFLKEKVWKESLRKEKLDH